MGFMGGTMQSREKSFLGSRRLVRGIFGLVALAGGLGPSSPAFALEPWEIPSQPDTAAAPESSAEETIEAGVALSLVFTAFGMGMGAAAASKDAESERKRDEPCRTCAGGFNDMQRDVEILGNASLLSFFAAGLMGVSTAIYAISIDGDEEQATAKRSKGAQAKVIVQGSSLGLKVSF